MMDHSEMGELLSAWADGELLPAQGEAVELHVAGCADCQRALAEFRLTRQHLALLADPFGATWHPDVAERVAARIRRRRRWAGWGRRLALNAASALAAGALLVALLWLLQHLPAMLPQEGGSADAPVADGTEFSARGRWFDAEPLTITEDIFGRIVASAGISDTGVLRYFDLPTVTLPANTMITVSYFEISDQPTMSSTKLVLSVPGRGIGLHLISGAAKSPAELSSWGTGNTSRLVKDGYEDVPDEDIFVVLERSDGTQTLNNMPGAAIGLLKHDEGKLVGETMRMITGLSLFSAPRLMTETMSDERLRLFLWLRGGEHSPVVEFTLDYDADGNWLFVEPRELDVAPALKIALPPPDTPSPTCFTLLVQDDLASLDVCTTPRLSRPFVPRAVQNLVLARREVFANEVFAVLEAPDGTQVTLDSLLHPWIPVLPGVRTGDRMRLFLWARSGDYSHVLEFVLDRDADGNWIAQDVQKIAATPVLRVALPPADVSSSTHIALETPGGEFRLHLFGADLLTEDPVNGAVRNLGYRLGGATGDAFVVVEVVDGEQMILSSDEAPSIRLPPGTRSGDRVRLFAATPDGVITPAVEFVLSLKAVGWWALDLDQADELPVFELHSP